MFTPANENSDVMGNVESSTGESSALFEPGSMIIPCLSLTDHPKVTRRTPVGAGFTATSSLMKSAT
jgi:hypothetical protein